MNHSFDRSNADGEARRLSRLLAELDLDAVIVSPDELQRSTHGVLAGIDDPALIDAAHLHARTPPTTERDAPTTVRDGVLLLRRSGSDGTALVVAARSRSGETDPRLASHVERALRVIDETEVARSRDRDMMERFSGDLVRSYEQTNLMFQFARMVHLLDRPVDSLRDVVHSMVGVLPIPWAALTFSRMNFVHPDLRGRTLVAGELGGSEDGHRGAVESALQAIIATSQRPNFTGIVDPGEDPLADASGMPVLVDPIRSSRGTVGVLCAGARLGPDEDVHSEERQFLHAVCELIGVMHENLVRFANERDAFLGTLQALTTAVDAKDRYTRGHSQRVAHLARLLAIDLGLDEETVEQVHLSGIVHDVGKIGVPDNVLCKPGRLTDDEFAIIRRHPETGHQILKDIPAMEPLLPGVIAHHERWDGRGYPYGLQGTSIPLFGRILALADTFDAMSSTRSYRSSMPREKVLAEIVSCAGSQFDPQLVPVFVALDFTEYDHLLAEHGGFDTLAA